MTDTCAPVHQALMPLAEALETLFSSISPLSEPQTIPLEQALDRILAQAIQAPINVPPADNSAMDGFALAFSKPQLTYKLVGQVLAGQSFNQKLQLGEAIRITTGAPIPEGTVAVVMQENAALLGDTLAVQQHPEVGENLRRAGEDLAFGSWVLPKGRRLTPTDLGLLASLGLAEVSVIQPLKVAILSTGDELTPTGQTLNPGEIYDSNRIMLIALLSRLGIQAIDLGAVPDQPRVIEAGFAKAIESADVLITSGGVSVGVADHTKAVLEKLGKIDFWKIAIKPGKPFAFGRLPKPEGGHCWFFGLPGNPVSAAVTYRQMVVPALRLLQGESLETSAFGTGLHFYTQAAGAFNKSPGRLDFQRSRLDLEGQIAPTGSQSSGVLSAFVDANCFAVLERERGKVEVGEEVEVQLFDRFLL